MTKPRAWAGTPKNGTPEIATTSRLELYEWERLGWVITPLYAPAAPGIDLEQFREAVVMASAFDKRMAGNKPDYDHLLARIDASPKGACTPAPRFELTNGQIAQLHDFAGTPVTGTPLEDQDVLVIQHADAGHSGPGLYAHYDELPEEGAIYLDGQLPDSPKGGSTDDRCDVDGTWLWCRLMDWCKEQGVAPANYDSLFAIATEAHKANAMQATSAEVGA